MKIWVVEDEKIGTANQALGLAMTLNLPFVRKKVVFNRLAALPNYLKLSRTGIKNADDFLKDGEPPDIVISAGRRLVNLVLAIKKKYGAKLIHLMNGGWYGRSKIDLVIVPKHDGLNISAPNIVYVSGMAHTLTSEKLAKEKEKWLKMIAVDKPSVAVIVGGSTKKRRFSETMANDLVRLIRSKFAGYGVMLTTSRRTGEVNEKIVADGLKDMRPYIYDFRSGGDNPYYAFLAMADAIVVTGDSMSMCSEAVFTGKRVFIYDPVPLLSAKHRAFHKELYDGKHAVPFNDDADIDFIPNGERFYPNMNMVNIIKERHLI